MSGERTFTGKLSFPNDSDLIKSEIHGLGIKDHTIGKFCGFSIDEIDYIINFDIKYRMGNELEEDED